MIESQPQLSSAPTGSGVSRRQFLGAMLGATSALGLTGLMPAAASHSVKAANAMVAQAKPYAGKTIRYQQRDATAEDFVRKVFAPQFEEQTGAKVVLEDIPQGELFAKVQVMAAAGQLGDLVFGFDNPWLANWATKGILRPLDDYAAADNYSLEQFYPSAAEAIKVSGSLYGLPTAGHPGVVNLFFNKTMFKDRGVTPPDASFPKESWKWDDVLQAAKTLTQDTNGDGKIDVWGFVPARFLGNWAFNHTRQFGSDVLSPDGKSTSIGNAQGQAVYAYLADLTFKDKVAPTGTDLPPKTGSEQMAGQYFATGKVAMFEDATILITTMDQYVKDKFEWGVFPIPKGPAGTRGGTTFLNTTSVTKQSKEPEVAWAFLKLIASHDAGVKKLLMHSGSPGARPDVFQDPQVIKAFPWYQVGGQVMSEAKRSYIPANFRTTELFNAILQTEAEIWLGKLSGADGAKKLQSAIEGILGEAS